MSEQKAKVKNDLLIEIGTEELPPKALRRLSAAFTDGVVAGLKKAGFEVSEFDSFATPRRLAVLIKNIADSQPERNIERKGPALKAAFDEAGNPTKAAQGFARSCGVEVDQLQQRETDKGTWLMFSAVEKGQPLSALIADIVTRSLAGLPIPKRMRWGDKTVEFVRPVHWIVLMFGSEVIEAEIFGINSSRCTHGHRFHTHEPVTLDHAAAYQEALRTKGYVLADFEQRQQFIKQQVLENAEKLGGTAVIDSDLLEEVTALNEWPVAVAGKFEAAFLSVPAQALIKTMQDNQKYFPLVDGDGRLKNNFITISNIASLTPEKVRAGNERVIRPRLADARFFWEQDQKQPLEAFAASLENVVFQKKLGTIADKTRRVSTLAEKIATMLEANVAYAKRAAVLSKCDLMTEMVGEFASLQGVMGKRYAEVGGEPEEVAIAIDEQYKPRGASDNTAATATGQILSISDKLDTLVGIFAIGQKPTGVKDPYALRRASLGILRTIIERGLDLDLVIIIHQAAMLLADKVDASKVEKDVFDYMIDRLRAYYLDRDIPLDVFEAVVALKPVRPLDFDRRIKAVTLFRALPEAVSLAAANKRVGNILKKSVLEKTVISSVKGVDEALLEEKAEKALYAQLKILEEKVTALFDAGDYASALKQLSVLREPVDNFFDTVMVIVEEEKIRKNRIALLNSMHTLFLRVADLSRLHQT